MRIARHRLLGLLVLGLVGCKRAPPSQPLPVPMPVAPAVPKLAPAVPPPAAPTPVQLPVASSHSGRDDLLSLDDAPRLLALVTARLRTDLGPGWLTETVQVVRADQDGSRAEVLTHTRDFVLLTAPTEGLVWRLGREGCTVAAIGRPQRHEQARCEPEAQAVLEAFATTLALLKPDAWPQARVESMQAAEHKVMMRVAIPELGLRAWLTMRDDSSALEVATPHGQARTRAQAGALAVRFDQAPGWTWQARTGTPTGLLPRAVFRVEAQGKTLPDLLAALDSAGKPMNLQVIGLPEFELTWEAGAVQFRAVQAAVLLKPHVGALANVAVSTRPQGSIETVASGRLQDLALVLKGAAISDGCHVVQQLGQSVVDAKLQVLVIRACPASPP